MINQASRSDINEFGIVQNKDWTCGLVDLWTHGLVDPWTDFFLNFTKMKKKHRGTEYDFPINKYHAALPRFTRKNDLIYSLSFVLYNIYSLRINQRQGVSAVDVGLFSNYWVSGNIDFSVSKIRPRPQVNRFICIRKHFVVKTIRIRYKCLQCFSNAL